MGQHKTVRKKAEMDLVTVMIGDRTYAHEDAFHLLMTVPFRLKRSCFRNLYWTFDSSVILHRTELAESLEDITSKILGHTQSPSAIFLILTRYVARMRSMIEDLTRNLRDADTDGFCYLYPIVMDGTARRVGLVSEDKALFSFYNSDAPSAGCARVAELINRIMGGDLPGEDFPDYPMSSLRRMAAHINWENFNAFSPKEFSLPKYPIKNGRPYFPVIEAEISCPGGCGRKVRLTRFDLDSDGNGRYECWNCGKGVIPKTNLTFDPWSEFQTVPY